MLVGRQATCNFDRWDRIACGFDEFTADTALCRILRCACRELQNCVRHAGALRLLTDCLGLLDGVSDIAAEAALRSADALPPWSRALDRFRRSFALAVRLLRGLSHELLAGSVDTFIFLLDMNQVFEAYAAAALGARFGVFIETQKFLGNLFPELPSGGIHQRADFYWQARDDTRWIADAKYKHLAVGQESALTFASDAATVAAGRKLSPDDIRQLTVYAELEQRRYKDRPSPHLALVYPFVGQGTFEVDRALAWNGSLLWLVPLKVKKTDDLGQLLPVF